MKNTLKEFRDFIGTGNLIDLSVAFVLGLAVKAVIDSFINGIVLNIIAAIVGKPNFDEIKIGIGDSNILIGTFITAVVNLLIVGAVLFAVVKVMSKFKKKDESGDVVTEISLLTEIRDSLKK